MNFNKKDIKKDIKYQKKDNPEIDGHKITEVLIEAITLEMKTVFEINFYSISNLHPPQEDLLHHLHQPQEYPQYHPHRPQKHPLLHLY